MHGYCLIVTLYKRIINIKFITHEFGHTYNTIFIYVTFREATFPSQNQIPTWRFALRKKGPGFFDTQGDYFHRLWWPQLHNDTLKIPCWHCQRASD